MEEGEEHRLLEMICLEQDVSAVNMQMRKPVVSLTTYWLIPVMLRFSFVCSSLYFTHMWFVKDLSIIDGNLVIIIVVITDAES